MQNCPVCGEEHSTFLNLERHMVQSERHEKGEHQEYLALLTGKPFAEYAFHNDHAIAMLLQKYYKKLRRLPTLDELEEARENKTK